MESKVAQSKILSKVRMYLSPMWENELDISTGTTMRKLRWDRRHDGFRVRSFDRARACLAISAGRWLGEGHGAVLLQRLQDGGAEGPGQLHLALASDP